MKMYKSYREVTIPKIIKNKEESCKGGKNCEKESRKEG
jgi:hypothetical protein